MEPAIQLDRVKRRLLGGSGSMSSKRLQNVIRGSGTVCNFRELLRVEPNACQRLLVDGAGISEVLAQRPGAAGAGLVDHPRKPLVAGEGFLHRGRIFLGKVLGAKGLVGVHVSMR